MADVIRRVFCSVPPHASLYFSTPIYSSLRVESCPLGPVLDFNPCIVSTAADTSLYGSLGTEGADGGVRNRRADFIRGVKTR